MQSDIVTGMDQISLLRPHPPSKGDGIIHQLMGMVGFVESQCIHHQQLRPLQISHLAFVHRLHVRDIGQFTDAIAQNG